VAYDKSIAFNYIREYLRDFNSYLLSHNPIDFFIFFAKHSKLYRTNDTDSMFVIIIYFVLFVKLISRIYRNMLKILHKNDNKM